ncbi:hypothetical protein U9M48_040716 [Paspalum notatum var. saurae]|uniref:DNA-directed RNA polymerase n=2 Tax=Paspalum notatum var. saurae TaxID=547442 RepID=A0AAQ3XCN5_PASNO
MHAFGDWHHWRLMTRIGGYEVMKMMATTPEPESDQLYSRRDIMSETKNVNIGMLPVMVKSNLCWLHKHQESDCQFDYGGYFLIKGMEKSKHSESCKIINISFLGTIIPIWVVFFALGASSDKEAFDMIDILDCDASIVNIISSTVKESHEGCEGFHIKSKFPPEEFFDEYVRKYMFPGFNVIRSKALFLAYMVKCLLVAYSGNRKCDNKDDFHNKRLGLACQLFQNSGCMLCLQRHMVKLVQRDLSTDGNLQDLSHYVDASIITNGLNLAFSTGSWRHPYKRERRSGVVGTLQRGNPLQMMSDLRKMRRWFWGKPSIDILVSCGMKKLDDIPLHDSSGKDRIFLNGELLGVCADPCELILRLKSLRRSKLIDQQVCSVSRSTKLTPNIYLVSQQQPTRRSSEQSEQKSELLLPYFLVEIKRDKHNKEVRIFSDPGRILGPLLVVENLRRITRPKGGLYSFQELVDQNIIELIGVEEEDIQCAYGIRHLFAEEKEERSFDYTHCELDPSFLLGLSGSLIPFANHDNAIRIRYPFTSIFYPHRPLFKTVVANCLGKADYSFGMKGNFYRPEYFNGQNAKVSVNVHQAFNQEDFLVFNRASLERDMFRTLHFKSYKARVKNKEITRGLKHWENINFGKLQSKRGRVDSLAVTIGQKGVVGLLDYLENFPFTCQGIVPDIVVNPHGFPSRQTPGQRLEAALGKGMP